MLKEIIAILAIPFYPIILPIQVWNEDSGIFKKIFTVIFSIVVLLPLWAAGYFFVGFTIWVILQWGGMLKMEVPVSGASMLPTFNESGYIKLYKSQVIEQLKPTYLHHDVVVFQNAETTNQFKQNNELRGGFVKRIIGMPGDTLVIRDGFVYRNGEMLEEPYIKDPRSTFGGKYLADCQPITIPEEKVFVMGDNRKVSMDSRDIGLIDKEDIEFYLPYEEQLQTASSKWRDASQDENYALQTEFNQDKYIAMLNQKRQELGLQKLKYQPKLTETARKRAEVMLQYNDLSFEATRSGYTMEKAMTEAGYWNVVYGEVPTLGYYNEQELFDSFFEYEESKEFFMEPEYNEIGISTFVGKINGCPVQIVVQHLAGYKPPNYTANEIQSWKNALDNLRQVQPGWQKLKENDNFYNKNKTKVDRINEIIKIRTANISGIVSKMQSDQWLTDQEKQYMNQDKALYKEQNELAEEINEIIN